MSKFEVFRSFHSGQWYWRLKARNGKIICASEGYRTRASAVKGVRSVIKNAPKAKIVFV